MSENKTGGKKLSTTQIILIVGIVAILAAVLAVGGLVVSRLGQQDQPDAQRSGPAAATAGALVLDSDRVDDIIAQMEQRAKEGMFDVTMKTVWTFPTGRAKASDAYVANSDTNWKPVYVDVALEDGTVVYTSPEIPVGYGIEEIKLDVPLEKGNYPCVCTYHLLNEDKTEATSVSVELQINILA